jgi:hypothetical protein
MFNPAICVIPYRDNDDAVAIDIDSPFAQVGSGVDGRRRACGRGRWASMARAGCADDFPHLLGAKKGDLGIPISSDTDMMMSVDTGLA